VPEGLNSCVRSLKNPKWAPKGVTESSGGFINKDFVQIADQKLILPAQIPVDLYQIGKIKLLGSP
jgi:hypothetical protein